MKILFLILIFLVNTIWGFESYNYVNKNYHITQEKDLIKKYKVTISPHFQKQKLQYFTSFDGLQIAYKIFKVQNPKATLLISSGRTEGMVKYKELIYDLNQNGYSVYILDHRGQGYSQRLLADPQIGHVEDFLDYVRDLRVFVKTIVKNHKKFILIGHSMGGAIASLYVETYRKDFDALVLSSPMHQPELISKNLTKRVCKFVEKREKNNNYIIGEKPYDEGRVDFEENLLTHSKVRYELENLAYQMEPQVKIGGPSVHWIAEACKGSAMSVELARNIEIPVLLMQASADKIVNLQPQNEFCKNVGNQCRGIVIEKAYHELFVEKDLLRNKALSAMLDFISKI